MSNSDVTPPLYARSPDYVGEKPFAGDLFEREQLADKLTNYVDRLRDGCTIAIDAPWGDGKTWFGKNWNAKLRGNHRTVYFDAFEHDHGEDPFLALTAAVYSEMSSASDGNISVAARDKGKALGKALLPVAGKVAVNVLGHLLLGTSELSDAIERAGDSASDAMADKTKELIENRLKLHDEQALSVKAFRDTVTEFATSTEDPVVFFIDELDRCNPRYAVRLVERLKHFFDVPNLVFVLLLNREQLERSIRGVYGTDVDAHAYLGKFVHLFLKLPKRSSMSTGHMNDNWHYAWRVVERYKYDTKQNHRWLSEFVDALSQAATVTGMSLRDIEKAVALLTLSGLIGENAPYLAWPIALKLARPEVFSGIRNNDVESHRIALGILLRISEESNSWIRPYFVAQHQRVASGEASLSEAQQEVLRTYGPRVTYARDLMAYWLSVLDLA